jgi:hypothetical protein
MNTIFAGERGVSLPWLQIAAGILVTMVALAWVCL